MTRRMEPKETEKRKGERMRKFWIDGKRQYFCAAIPRRPMNPDTKLRTQLFSLLFLLTKGFSFLGGVSLQVAKGKTHNPRKDGKRKETVRVEKNPLTTTMFTLLHHWRRWREPDGTRTEQVDDKWAEACLISTFSPFSPSQTRVGHLELFWQVSSKQFLPMAWRVLYTSLEILVTSNTENELDSMEWK